MSKQVKLAARPREEAGRNAVKQVRYRGAVPAVIYGESVSPANLEVDRRELEQLLAHAASEHVLVDLEIEENGKSRNQLSLIQEVQHHPVRGDILHVDFHAVSASETITSEVPVEPVGEADGVKRFGGVLQQLVQAIVVECLPKDLPEVVRVDVTHLGIGQPLHISDLSLPEGVKAVADGEITVFLVSEPKVSDDSTATTQSAPEVLSEKKKAEAESS